MSDAARVAREWLHERSLSLDRTEDLAAMMDAYVAAREREIDHEWNERLCGGLSSQLAPTAMIAMHDRSVLAKAAEQTAALRVELDLLRLQRDGYASAYTIATEQAAALRAALNRASTLLFNLGFQKESAALDAPEAAP